MYCDISYLFLFVKNKCRDIQNETPFSSVGVYIHSLITLLYREVKTTMVGIHEMIPLLKLFTKKQQLLNKHQQERKWDERGAKKKKILVVGYAPNPRGGLLGCVFSCCPAQPTTVGALSLTYPHFPSVSLSAQPPPSLASCHQSRRSAAKPCRGSGSRGRRSRAPCSSTTRRAESSSYPPPPAPPPPPGALLDPKPSPFRLCPQTRCSTIQNLRLGVLAVALVALATRV